MLSIKDSIKKERTQQSSYESVWTIWKIRSRLYEKEKTLLNLKLNQDEVKISELGLEKEELNKNVL